MTSEVVSLEDHPGHTPGVVNRGKLVAEPFPRQREDARHLLFQGEPRGIEHHRVVGCLERSHRPAGVRQVPSLERLTLPRQQRVVLRLSPLAQTPTGPLGVARDVLLNEVWGYNAGVTTHTLETHIYRLRQKIEKDPSNSELLVTEMGGYKLMP